MVLPHSMPLVPLPASVIAGDGRLPVSESTRVIGDSPAAHQLIDAAERRTGIRFAHSPDTAGTTDTTSAIVLRVDPSVAREGYTLRVADSVEVVGGDEAGLFYGVQTLLQLLRDGDEGWALLRAEVTDAPRFERRGVMLDVTRHFFDVDEVKKFIDSTSALKFNHLHLHLSDDQGWRIQIDSWPKLTELASFFFYVWET